MEASDFADLSLFLSNQYGLEPTPETKNSEQLKKLLVIALKNVLQNHSERLLSIMYRLDINELKFMQAMECGNEQEQAEALAELVFEREIQRLTFRKNYKPPGGN